MVGSVELFYAGTCLACVRGTAGSVGRKCAELVHQRCVWVTVSDNHLVVWAAGGEVELPKVFVPGWFLGQASCHKVCHTYV